AAEEGEKSFLVDTGEACDNGAQNSSSVPNACRTSCIQPACNDGVVDAGEDCDDADTIASDGCDLCAFATQHVGTAVPQSLDVASRASDGQLTLLYTTTDVNGQHLLTQIVPAAGSDAGSAAAVTGINTLSPSGASLLYPSIAQSGNSVAVAYTHAYPSSLTDSGTTVTYNVQRTYIATSSNGGTGWTGDLRMDTQALATTLPSNGGCPKTSFTGVSDGAHAAVGYIAANLAVLTNATRSYATTAATCTTPPTGDDALTSSLSADNGASFSPNRVAVTHAAGVGPSYAWGPTVNGKAVVGFFPTLGNHPAFSTGDGGVSWAEQHAFSMAPYVTTEAPNTVINVPSTRAFQTPTPGTMLFYDLSGRNYSVYTYGSTGADWTALQDLPLPDTDFFDYKRQAVGDGGNNVTMLWSEGNSTTNEMRLYRVHSTNGGESYGSRELLLTTNGTSRVALVDAQMDAAGAITALVCVGNGMKPRGWQIKIFTTITRFLDPAANIPCANPASLGLLRWQDGSLPDVANIENVTSTIDLVGAHLVHDTPQQASAVWGASSAGSEGVYVRRLR
ncbi:MAG: DUF4215 domain-containing protein, partial [Myxococcota bacterium]